MVMRMTVHSKMKETPLKRHYGKTPRTDSIPVTTNLFRPNRKHYKHSFNNRKGGYDQLIMKTPRRLECYVSNNFPYKFLKKKQSKNKIDGEYQTKPQIAVTVTKLTKNTDKNNIIHRKLAREPFGNSFQNPQARRVES